MKIKGSARFAEPATPMPELGRWFYCYTCTPKEYWADLIKGRMTMDEAKQHLREKHGLNASGGDFQGSRTWVIHAGSRDYYLWIYHWKVGNVTLIEHEITPRRPMR